jgi:hypothetical protein
MKLGAVYSRKTAIALVATSAMIFGACSSPADAQGLLDFLFRPLFHHASPPPDQRSAYAPEFVNPEGVPDRGSESRGDVLSGPRISGGSGRFTFYCVRLCDGRYFPVQPAHAGELCSAFCPATPTKVFSGSEMEGARASDGTRYGDLENAFVYRDHFVDGCTCNGADPVGLAKIDIKDDPTVRRGDMVATADGPKKIEGASRSASAEDRPPPRPRYSRRRDMGFPFSFFR